MIFANLASMGVVFIYDLIGGQKKSPPFSSSVQTANVRYLHRILNLRTILKENVC
jgi:hypothetical protein